MSSSPALKWFLIGLCPLLIASVAWKFAAVPQPTTASIAPKQRVADFLSRQHFYVAQSWEIPGGTDVMRATRDACHMIVALTSPRGWDRDMIRQLAEPTDRMFVVFHGEIYAEQPMVLTVADFLWTRLLGELGVKKDFAPVITVLGPPSCEAEHLPWREIA